VLRGLHRFALQNAVTIVGALVGNTALVVVLLLGGGLLGMALVNIGVMLVVQVPTVWLIRRAAPDLGFGWRGGAVAPPERS
jgi:hypothetical protein